MSRSFPVVVLFASLSLIGCGVSEGEVLADDGLEASEEALSTITPGRYVPAVPPALDFNWLELKSGGSYVASVQVYCITTPCYPVEERGTYRLSRSGHRNLLTLTTTGGAVRKVYVAKVASALVMRDPNDSAWYVFYRHPLLPETCGGAGVTAPRGGCPVTYHCTCPNGAYCLVAGECVPD